MSSLNGRHESHITIPASLTGIFITAPWALTPAAAQETTPAPTVEQIVVTGSRILRDGYEAPTPVTVFGAEEMRNSRPKDLADLVQQIPSVSYGSDQAANRQLSSGQVGTALASLRGLGSNRTLVLLDGHRTVMALQTGEVDTEGFPQQLISRVDIVTGGASSAYGSDAIAGVINYVIDKEFTGFKSEVSGGITDYGDNESGTVRAAYGTPFADGRGHLLLSGEWHHTAGILGDPDGRPPERMWNYDDISFAANPAYTATNGQPQYIRVPRYVPATATRGGIITGGPLRGTAFDSNGNPYTYAYGTLDLQGYQYDGPMWEAASIKGSFPIWPRINRHGVFSRVSFDVSDNVNIWADFSQNFSDGLNGSCGCNRNLGTLTLRIDNAYLPQSVRQRGIAAGVTQFPYGVYMSDVRELGYTSRRVTRYSAGVDGTFDAFGRDWSFDVYLHRGTTEAKETTRGNVNIVRRANAIDAVVDPATGRVVCRINIDSNPSNNDPACAPMNIIGQHTSSQAALDYVVGTSQRLQQFSLTNFEASVTGEPFSLWAGPVSLALGAEYRRITSDGSIDPTMALGQWNVQNVFPLIAEQDVTEGFGEVVIPLATDTAWARSLEFNGAVRATDYSTSGSVVTWKTGLTWQPIEDVRFRFVRSRDIRAPNLTELYQTGGGATQSAFDPIIGQTIQYRLVTVGNPDLEPEVGNTTSVGVVWQPSFLDGFSASADYARIKVNGLIAPVGPENILNQCFLGTQAYCDAITRPPVAPITEIRDQPFNVDYRILRVLDLDASYRTSLGRLISGWRGDLTFRAVATRNLKSITVNGLTAVAQTNAVGGDALPYWRYRTSLSYELSQFRTALVARGIGAHKVNASYIECTSGCPTSTPARRTVDNNHVPHVVFVDASFSYRPELFDAGETEFFLQIDNITNKDPAYSPRAPGGNNISFMNSAAGNDVLGRVYRAGVEFKF